MMYIVCAVIKYVFAFFGAGILFAVGVTIVDEACYKEINSRVGLLAVLAAAAISVHFTVQVAKDAVMWLLR